MTEAELEIMETLWAKGEPIYLGELLEVFNARTNKDWKKQTLNTFLVKMQQKIWCRPWRVPDLKSIVRQSSGRHTLRRHQKHFWTEITEVPLPKCL